MFLGLGIHVLFASNFNEFSGYFMLSVDNKLSRMKNVFLGIILICFGIKINAQDVSDQGIDFDSVEVTSFRTIQNITKTGRNVLVITSDKIKELPVHSTDELLRYVPGMEVQSRGGYGVQSDLTLRGSTFNQVLVMVDGVRINDPLTGHFNGYIPVPLSEIERIEVIKGTASSIYGVDAVGGVVNIITKVEPNNEQLDIDASAKVGSNSYSGYDLSIFGKENKWKFSIGAQSNKSKGQQFTNPNYYLVEGVAPNYNTWFETNTFSGSVGRSLGEHWKIGLRSSFDERNFNAKYFYTASAYDESVERTSVFFNDLKLSGTAGKFKTEIDLAFRQSTDEFIFNPLFTKNNHTTRFGLLQVNQSYRLSDQHTFVYGVQLDTRSIESNDRGNHTNSHAGVYAQWIGTYIKNLTSTVSLRTDYDDNYEWEWSPQLNLAYIYNKFVFRGGLGRGIRAADYTERYVSNNLEKLSPGRNIGNPDLTAESSWSYEAGVDYYLNSGLKIVATGFYRASDDLIDYVPTLGSKINNVPVQLVPDENYLYSQNLSIVNTMGVEVELWYTKQFNSGDALTASLGYTGLESSNPEGTVSKYVSAHAKHLLNGNILMRVNRFDFGLSGLYKMREAAYSNSLDVELKPSYTVVNLSVGMSVLNNKCKIQGEIINLFDEDYSDILGARMPGRWFNIGASVKL